MSDTEIKILRQKKLDKDSHLVVKLNEMSSKILVEFRTNDGKLFIQKSYQNTAVGIYESKEFQNSIKSTRDIKKYFGLLNRENENVIKSSIREN